MNITLNGKAARTIGTLQVGESGYIAEGKLHDGVVADDAKVWPSRSDIRFGCFHVTRTDGGLDLVTIAEKDDDELVVIESSATDFATRMRAFHATGWRVYVDSIRVTPDGVGGFSYLVVMYREASE